MSDLTYLQYYKAQLSVVNSSETSGCIDIKLGSIDHLPSVSLGVDGIMIKDNFSTEENDVLLEKNQPPTDTNFNYLGVKMTSRLTLNCRICLSYQEILTVETCLKAFSGDLNKGLSMKKIWLQNELCLQATFLKHSTSITPVFLERDEPAKGLFVTIPDRWMT